jgi:hypothetical protein
MAWTSGEWKSELPTAELEMLGQALTNVQATAQLLVAAALQIADGHQAKTAAAASQIAGGRRAAGKA